MKVKIVYSLIILSSAISAFASTQSNRADAIAAFSQNQPTKVETCLKAYNIACSKTAGRALSKDDLYEDAKESCIKIDTKDGAVDYVVFTSKNEKLVSIFPLSTSQQQCAQIQLKTTTDIINVVKFGSTVAIATGGRLFEFHSKSLKNYSTFFINEILNQRGNSYKTVSSIEAMPQSDKLLVKASGGTFVIDDQTVAPESKRSNQIGKFHGVRTNSNKLDLN